MAGARWVWTRLLLVAALHMCAASTALTQSAQNGSLSGKLTDLHSIPVAGATVLVRNQATGAEASTTTTKNGSFRFSALGPGEYLLEAESPRLGSGHVEGIEIDAGHEVRVQTAVDFSFPRPRPLQVVFHHMEPERPTVTAALEPQPILGLALGSGPVHQHAMPSTVPVELNAALGAAPMQALPLGGRSLAHVSNPGPLAPLAPSTGPPLAAVHNLPSPAAPSLVWVEAAARSVPAVIRAEALPPGPNLTAAQSPDPITPAETTTLPGEQLQTLPATGRRWQDFVLDTPTSNEQSGGENESSQRGTTREPTAVTVDGASRRLAFGGRGSWVRGRGTSMSTPSVSEAAIREVSATSGNAGSEASHADSGSFNVETRRGANALHGQGFLFDRENTWGARNPFTQWVKETQPGTAITTPIFAGEPFTPPDHEITWGAGLGGHLLRNKLLWFGALDGFDRNDPGVATVRHPDQFFAQPSNDQMQVLGARLGLTGVNPVKLYSGMLETLAGLLGPAPRSATQWTGFGRLDWQAGERHRFTLEGTGARWNFAGGGMTRVSEMLGTHSFGSTKASEQWILGRWEAFLTANLLAVSQVSAGRTIQTARPEAPSAFEQGLLAGNLWSQLPQIVVDSRYGFTIGNPSRFGQGSYPDERLYQGQESLSWVRGKLMLKTGFSLGHNADATSLLRNQTGTYSYASVENFISDALAFQNFASDPLDPLHQHGCDQTGRVWHDALGPRGRGPLPCYSYYSQTIGPAAWSLSTTDWAGYTSAQWQQGSRLVLSAGLRWEREQLPPPIASLANPDLPLTQRLPNLGNNWGPRLGLAWGNGDGHWPVLRLGYGMYFGRTQNAVVEAALTQTGSRNGDLRLFMRPTDDLPNYGGGAPPFPYVLAGQPGKVIKPGAVEFAPNFRNAEVHQAILSLEESLPGRIHLAASAMVSLGRRLPISIDTNFDPAANPGTITYVIKDDTGEGPIKKPQITVPFYASWPSPVSASGVAGRLNPNYQQIAEIFSRANSTYEAAMLRVVRYGRRGLNFHLRYTLAHAMDWNPNESMYVDGNDVLDPGDFRQEYGTSNLDIRHSLSTMIAYQAPWKFHGLSGHLANGWLVSGVGNLHSGRPYTMRTSGSLAGEFTANGDMIQALAQGMNGSGGDDRVYGVGRNTYRYPLTWKADLRVAKRFDLGRSRQLELLAESYNLFNHQNVTRLETTGYYISRGSSLSDAPTLTFLSGTKINSTAFGKPLDINATNFYRERQIQFGLRMRF